jgi:hypothetical protein
VAAKVAAIYNIEPDEMLHKGRQKPRVDAKGLFCFIDRANFSAQWTNHPAFLSGTSDSTTALR